jgi:hypothetical protein
MIATAAKIPKEIKLIPAGKSLCDIFFSVSLILVCFISQQKFASNRIVIRFPEISILALFRSQLEVRIND